MIGDLAVPHEEHNDAFGLVLIDVHLHDPAEPRQALSRQADFGGFGLGQCRSLKKRSQGQDKNDGRESNPAAEPGFLCVVHISSSWSVFTRGRRPSAAPGLSAFTSPIIHLGCITSFQCISHNRSRQRAL